MNNDLENKIEKKIFDFAKSIMVSFTNEEQEISIEVGDIFLKYTSEKKGKDWNWELIDLTKELKVKKTELKEEIRKLLNYSEEICINHSNYPHASIKLMKTKSSNYFLLDGGGMSSEEISFINEKNKEQFINNYKNIKWDFEKLLKENTF